MVVCCCVRGCSNDWRPNCDFRFHRFPIANTNLLDKWVKALALNEFIPKSHSRICSAHFVEGDYYILENSGKKMLLKPNAVPSIIQDTIRPTTRKLKAFNCLYSHNSDTGCTVKRSQGVSTQTCLMDMAPDLSVTKEFWRRKIKILQQKLKRRNEKICKMRKHIVHLRNEDRASEKIKYVLQKHFNGFSAELFQHQYKNNKVKPKQRRYSESMKMFALKLYLYSPCAYKFVRKYLQLPHSTTLRQKESSNQLVNNVQDKCTTVQ